MVHEVICHAAIPPNLRVGVIEIHYESERKATYVAFGIGRTALAGHSREAQNALALCAGLQRVRFGVAADVAGDPHRAKSVARLAQAGKLALFFLPPYSPELNPDEFVWNDLKSHCTGRKLITPLSQLRQTVVSHMRQLQKLPDLVRSFFHGPATRYARA